MSLLLSPAWATPLNEDGLHQQDWFLQQSFLELADDWQEANAEGRGLAIIWELAGCPSCARMHKDYLSQAAIRDLITQHFHVLQLNYTGLRRVTDFDGQEMTERELAKRHGIEGTPTWQFYPAGSLPSSAGADAERIQGLPSIAEFTHRIRMAGQASARRMK